MKQIIKQVCILGLFLALGVLAIMGYYTGGLHLENATGSFAYFLVLLFAFGSYEWVMIALGKKERSIGVIGIISALLGTILVTAIATYSKAGTALGWGFILFFQILKYAFFPLVIALISAGFGRFLVKKIGIDEKISSDMNIILSLGLGFSAFITINATLGFFGIFQVWSALGILGLMVVASYKDTWEVLTNIAKYRFKVLGEWHAGLSVPAVISAVLLLMLFVLISVNLTNVVRPYPIGWDDLGVYMNYPRIMAQVGNTGGMGMVLWQTFTAIGQMFNSAPQAFFLNQMGSLLTILALFFGIRTLIPEKPRYLSLPLLASTIFMAMPMVIFQQAKDMKLDPGLFGISVIALVTFLVACKENSDRSLRNRLIFIAGILIGIAFAIKFTSLMLIIGAIAALFYVRMGFAGFVGFTSIFISLFTALRLWDFLNVNYPKDRPQELLVFSVVLGAFGLIMLAWGIYKNRGSELIKNLLLPLGLLVVGIAIPLMPWLIKNVVEVGSISKLTISGLLSGKSDRIVYDYHTIYSDTDLKKIQETIAKSAISADGKSQNEDLGRYFGYENGINNYLKLPLNLTNQSNQGGEFTDITYLYLALVPGALLLFGFGNIAWLGLYTLFVLGLFWYYFLPGISTLLTTFFGAQNLPIGYITIALISLTPFVIIHFSSRKKVDTLIFRTLFAFTTLYTLLFIVAAFGIVWYGILMYFCFLAIVVMCFESKIAITSDSEERRLAISTTTALVIIIFPFFILSGLPHAWNNIPSDSLQFKSGTVTQDEAIFLGHPEYLPVIAKLNLQDESKLIKEVLATNANEQLKKYFEGYERTSVNEVANELITIERSATTATNSSDLRDVIIEAKRLRHALYDGVLVPAKDNRNQASIYRIGTFLTYYISQNGKRFFDDSLIFEFDRYMADTDREVTIDRMKKLGMKYLLVDLNAATIDRDPRHDLTRRYERVLDLLKSKNLSLISTDSACLQVALENIDKPDAYMNLAGVNYRTYAKTATGEDGVIIAEKKLALCTSVISHLIYTKQVSDKQYPFLKNLSDQVLARSPKSEADIQALISPVIGRGWMAAFEIK